MSNRFSNPPGSPRQEATGADFAAFFFRRVMSSWKRVHAPQGHVVPRADALEQLAHYKDVDSITWLGHASFYIRLGGVGVLVDPFLSQYAGPGMFGPKRHTAPELTAEDFDPVDVVLISHNHYDHLDAKTLSQLLQRRQVPVVSPRGLQPLLRKIGFKTVIELDWYDSHAFDRTRIVSLPSIHWSKRGLNDENLSHWAGYLLEFDGFNIFYTGDTGYGPVFSEIGKQYGPIDVGLVPIGAYEPRSIMRSSHATPEEGVKIGIDTQCRRLIPMHWGTIVLTDEDPWEPPGRFHKAAQEADYGDGARLEMKVGETIPARE